MTSRVRKAGLFLLLAVVSWTGCQQDPQSRRDRHFREGKKATEQEKYLEAEIHFRNAVKADPDFTAGHYYLGLTSRKLGRIPEAARAFQQTLDLDAEHAGAALELGEIYLLAKEPQRARELAEGILNREEQNFPARILLAKSYLGEKNFFQARTEFEKAKVLEPGNPAVSLAIGIAEIGAGNPRAAETNFKQALGLDKTRIESYENLANLYLGLNRLPEAERTLIEGTKSNSDNTRIHLTLADFYFRTGRLKQVESVLESLKTRIPDRGRLLVELGDFWVSHNQLSRAVTEYQASLSVQPSAIVIKKLTNAYITLGDVAEAARWNQQTKQENPKDHEARMFQGAIAYLRGETVRAISHLEAIVARDPTSIFAHYYLGAAYLADGKLEQARTHFYECVKYDEKFVHAYLRLAELSLRKRDPANAAEYAKKVIALKPWMLEGYLLAADAALMERDAVQAKQALQVARRMYPEHFLVSERWAALYTLQKRYRRAELEYQLALASSPTPEKTLSRMARYYIARGQVTKGLREVQRYMDSHGPTPRLHELSAQLYLAQGAWSEAVAACEKALALEPNRLAPQVYRGQALTQLGRLEEAARSFEGAIRADPQRMAPYLRLGDLQWRQGKFSRAVEYYRQALNLDSSSPVAQAGLARALADAEEDLVWALSLARQAKQQRPDEPVVSDALAWVYHKRGMNDLALPVLQECVAQDRKNPVFQYHLGMVYLKSGRRREGRRLLQTALQNGLTSPYASGAQETLSSLGGV
jgi:tetratricopeptide (TPR) repeat protein